MKFKRTIAIGLCIGLIASSFSGAFISYAKKSDKNEEIISEEVANIDSFSSLAPTPVITELAPELEQKKKRASKGNISEWGKKEVVTYNDAEVSDFDDKVSDDVYTIGNDEMNELLQKGYFIEDILEADDMGNELLINPLDLLEKKASSKQSLKEIKEDILKERIEIGFNYLKEKYPQEYDKLKGASFSQEEILSLLSYIDMNNLILTDELLKEYESMGDKLFQKEKDNSISDETKKKYQLTDKEAEKLTEDLIISLENLAKKVDKPVKDLIISYLKNN